MAMKPPERIPPIAAAASALATLLCCLPLGFAAAAATAGVAIAVAKLRPWLLGASVLLVVIGFVPLYRRPACDRRSPPALPNLGVSCPSLPLLPLVSQP